MGEHTDFARLDAGTNEFYLLHGVRGGRAVAEVISQQGFDERISDLERCLYGAGIYTAEQSCKAIQYAAPDDQGKRYAFYSRVTLGRAHSTKTALRGQRRAPDGYDSVVANTLLANAGAQVHREFIVYDRNQIYPEFLVCFKV